MCLMCLETDLFLFVRIKRLVHKVQYNAVCHVCVWERLLSCMNTIEYRCISWKHENLHLVDKWKN